MPLKRKHRFLVDSDDENVNEIEDENQNERDDLENDLDENVQAPSQRNLDEDLQDSSSETNSGQVAPKRKRAAKTPQTKGKIFPKLFYHLPNPIPNLDKPPAIPLSEDEKKEIRNRKRRELTLKKKIVSLT